MDYYFAAAPLVGLTLAHRLARRAYYKFKSNAAFYGTCVSSDPLEGDIYRINSSDFHFVIGLNEITAVLQSPTRVTSALLLSLVIDYDSLVADLVRVILSMNPGMLKIGDKSFTFEEILAFSSLDEAKKHIIDSEVEAVLRMSHPDQVRWFEKRLKLDTLTKLPAFPAFVEVTQRRNIVTHNKGRVSKQYLDVCRRNNIDTQHLSLDDDLTIDSTYLMQAVETIYEYGLELGHLIWRKVKKEEQQDSDSRLSAVGYELLRQEHYDLARRVLRFAHEDVGQHASDSTRRMIIVNRANACKLSGDFDEAKRIIAADDWSATSDQFQISIAAVLDEYDEAISLMHKIGKDGVITSTDYKTWPVFIRLRERDGFRQAYRDIFGESFLSEPYAGQGVSVIATDDE